MQFRRVPGRDSAQVVTPFVQVGTSSRSPVSRGTDYAFISVSRAPAYGTGHGLPFSLGWTGASPRRDQSLRGHASRKGEAEGFPRHYPPSVASSLIEAAGEGFAVMSGIDVWSRLRTGQVVLPDKEFRSSRPHVAMGEGPYLQLTRRGELAGVWPLRIPGIETASDGSWSARPSRSGSCPPPRGGASVPSCERSKQTSESPRLSPFSVGVLRRTERPCSGDHPSERPDIRVGLPDGYRASGCDRFSRSRNSP
jgi:hypothetical protein